MTKPDKGGTIRFCEGRYISYVPALNEGFACMIAVEFGCIQEAPEWIQVMAGVAAASKVSDAQAVWINFDKDLRITRVEAM